MAEQSHTAKPKNWFSILVVTLLNNKHLIPVLVIPTKMQQKRIKLKEDKLVTIQLLLLILKL